MPTRILHVIESSTPPEALGMLALLLRHGVGEQAVLGMGHRVTGELAVRAGIGGEIAWVPSLGWGDPSGWRGVRREIREFEPTHVHVWGAAGAVATALAGFSGGCVGSFAEVPSRSQMRGLRLVDRRASKWTWVGSSLEIVGALREGGVAAERMVKIVPGVGSAGVARGSTAELREELEIGEGEGPVILLGGEGRRARHDYGLWAGAILQQIYPRLRVVVRDDGRGGRDEGLARFLGSLPEGRMVVVAAAERRWEELLGVADLLLVTPDGAMGTGSILAAMAAGVPVVGTPVACVRELIEDGRNGLLAKEVKPRSIAARLEGFLDDGAVREGLVERARAEVVAGFGEGAMVAGYERVYGG